MDWKSTHPLLRYAGFDNVQIAQSLTAKTPTWAVSVLEAPQAPLILAGELERQRIVWIGFDMLESNWPLRVSFPIFIANAVDWLNPASARNSQLLVKAGDPFRLALSEPVNSAQVTLPNGTVKPLAVDANANEIVFGDTAKQGIYHLRAGTNDTVFCVDLLDAAESNIKPRDEFKLGEYSARRGHDGAADEPGIVADDRGRSAWRCCCLNGGITIGGRCEEIYDLPFTIDDLRRRIDDL